MVHVDAIQNDPNLGHRIVFYDDETKAAFRRLVKPYFTPVPSMEYKISDFDPFYMY